MPNHGPQHDVFGRAPSHGHNGTEFDEGFNRDPGTGAGAHGAQYDEFETRARVSKHGERWDEFGWESMPAKHGQLFDSDFGQPRALDGGEHGTWMDVFRGGTELRYMYGGKDLEGVVLNATRTHLLVAPRTDKANGGGRHEVGLGQIQAWREGPQPSKPKGPTAHPGNTPAPIKRSDAEAPSAHNRKAQGGGRKPVDVSVASDVSPANKTAPEDGDTIAKSLGHLRVLAGLEEEVEKGPFDPAVAAASMAAAGMFSDEVAKYRTRNVLHHAEAKCTAKGCGSHFFHVNSNKDPYDGVRHHASCANCGTLHSSYSATKPKGAQPVTHPGVKAQFAEHHATLQKLYKATHHEGLQSPHHPSSHKAVERLASLHGQARASFAALPKTLPGH